MTDPQPQTHRPNGVTGLAGDAIDALKTSPVLLLIVILNMAFAGGAAYFMTALENHRATDRGALISLLEKCTLHTIPIEALSHFSKDKPE